MTIFGLCWMLLGGVPLYVVAQDLPGANGIPAHPRILLQKGRKETVHEACRKEGCWKTLDEMVKKTARELLDEPVTSFHYRGKTMLPQARELFRKIFYLSYAYQFTGEVDFAKRGIQEVLHACTLDSWNPQVFLDVAEMTMAVSLAYDWLYHQMDVQEREQVKKSLVEKGILPSYDDAFNQFLALDNNWNQVCNAAMVWASIAIYDEAPELAMNTIKRSLDSSQLPMSTYGENGGFPEGLMYWTYGTTFHTLMLAALEPIMHDQIAAYYSPGFLASGQFFVHMIANSGDAFNWSDALEKHYLNPAIFWMAATTGDPSLLWNEKKVLENMDFKGLPQSRMLPAVILLGTEFMPEDIPAPSSKAWRGKGDNEVVTMRTSWQDANGIFLGLKLGNAHEHHAHMDMGAFVLEADGVRWAMDMGMQDYHSLSSKKVNLWDSSQHGGRWTVFRHNNYGHNTLTLDDSLMDVEGKAKLMDYNDTGTFRFAVGDLTDVFLRKDRKVMRGVGIKEDKLVIIRDEISSSPEPVSIRWQMVTPAKVRIQGNKALLKKDGEHLSMIVKSSTPTKIKMWPAHKQKAYDAPNKGVNIVGFELLVPEGKPAAIEVLLIPGSSEASLSSPSLSLSEWK